MKCSEIECQRDAKFEVTRDGVRYVFCESDFIRFIEDAARKDPAEKLTVFRRLAD